MADLSDVEQAFADCVTAALYPEGTSQGSILGALCRVYRGWPNAATLNSDLTSGIINVTVLADNDSGQTTSRYLPEWQFTPNIPGTNISATGSIIDVSGIPVVGDVVGVLIDDVAYAYRICKGDTAMQVAAGLSQAIQKSRMVSLSNTTILVHGTSVIMARVVCDTSAAMEVRRQEKDVRVACWCSSPIIRDSAASALDGCLAENPFITLPDSTAARVHYKSTSSYDQAQNALLYRRDLVYMVEYPTVATFLQPAMLFGDAALNSISNYG